VKLEPYPRVWRIVATLGPASSTPEVMEGLVRGGLSVARLNFSHGTHETHRELVNCMRAVAKRLDQPVAILQDLQGHKVRCGRLTDAGAITLTPGHVVHVGAGETVTCERLGLDYEGISDHVEIGHKIFLDDGLIRLQVVGRDGKDLVCKVRVGGLLQSRKGAIFPDSELKFPLLNDRDMRDARFGVELGVDMVAMSFVRSAAEILEMRRRLAEWGEPKGFIVAKIEDPIGFANLDDILYVSDAVLIARGDLGVTFPREHVPGVQKEIIRRAGRRGVAVITATQMLESMTHVDQPTRAEVNDVHNAVMDGTDAVMLSGETASGAYPVLALEEMDRICAAATEDRLKYATHKLVEGRAGLHAQVAEAAARMAQTTRAICIVAFSLSGAPLRALAAARSPVPVYGVVPDESVRRRLQLHWGLSVTTLPRQDDGQELVSQLLKLLVTDGVCRPGDRVVFVGGGQGPESHMSPVLQIHEIA